jgi:hypothetical protein
LIDLLTIRPVLVGESTELCVSLGVLLNPLVDARNQIYVPVETITHFLKLPFRKARIETAKSAKLVGALVMMDVIHPHRV